MLNYELSLWTHSDSFVRLLRGSSEFKGQAHNVVYTKNINEEEKLSFSIPLYLFNEENNSYSYNTLCLITLTQQKIKLILNKGQVDESIHDFMIVDYTEQKNDNNTTMEINCQSYINYELSKVGLAATFSETSDVGITRSKLPPKYYTINTIWIDYSGQAYIYTPGGWIPIDDNYNGGIPELENPPETGEIGDVWKDWTYTGSGWILTVRKEMIANLIDNEGYIPIATPDDIRATNYNSTSLRTFGLGTQWEGIYAGGAGKKFVQVQDIDLAGIVWDQYIYAENIIYDGLNFKISNLSYSGQGFEAIGLFGDILESTIRHIRLENFNIISDADRLGGLSGWLESSIAEDCSIENSTIQGFESVGGLFGIVQHLDYDLIIKRCYVKNCTIIGDTSLDQGWTATSIGGMIGHLFSFRKNSSLMIENCYVLGGEVRGISWVGSFIGGAEGGWYPPEIYYFKNCYASSLVTILTTPPPTNPYEPSGTYCGGFAGSYEHFADEGPNMGNYGEFIDCHFDYQVAGMTCSDEYYPTDYPTGNTTSEMKLQSTYTNWDFINTWKIESLVNNGYPTLRIQDAVADERVSAQFFVVVEAWDHVRVNFVEKITIDTGDTNHFLVIDEHENQITISDITVNSDTEIILHLSTPAYGGFFHKLYYDGSGSLEFPLFNQMVSSFDINISLPPVS